MYIDQGTRSFNVDVRIEDEEMQQKLGQLISTFLAFEVLLSEHCKPTTLKETIKAWLRPKPMGTADCMRAELMLRYNGQ
jgi:hypothetical protein